MTKEIVPFDTPELDRLAQEINEAHKEVGVSFGHSLTHAIRAGELLEKAKSIIPHGQWLPWLERKARLSEATARRYRNVAMNKKLLVANSSKVTDLTIDAALKLIQGGEAMLQSMSNDWWTPKQYIDAVVEVMGGIDLDPASTPEANKTVGAKRFYTEESDGLSDEHIWEGRVFLNPPYGKLGSAFASKLYESLGSGVDEAIMLVNSRATDADWFQNESFGRGIRVSDVDGMVECKGRFLFLEGKPDGVPLSTGQGMALRALARLPGVSVIVIRGLPPDRIVGWEILGRQRRSRGTAAELAALIRIWFETGELP